MKRKLQVARHEAAHAVIAEKLGCKVEVVKITRADRGYVSHFCKGRPDPMIIGMIAMSGHAADLKWSRGRKTMVPADDHRIVLRFGFGGRSLPTLLALARCQVEEHAKDIERIARVLLERDLTGRELRKILRGASC